VKRAIVLTLLLLLPTRVTGQTVAQGAPGVRPWAVTCTNCSGTTGPGQVDTSTFTLGTTVFAPVGGTYETTMVALSSGVAAALRMTPYRAVHVNLRDAAGVEILPLTDGQLRASAVPVSGTFFQATQPVSGTFWQATQPVSGTVTANQGGTWTVQPGNTANTTAWKVDGSAVTQPVSGTFWQATQPISGTVTANAGTNLNTSALALEAGHLATIDTSTAKIPSQGQALAAASLPVVLTAAQVTTLTPPAAIAGFALEAGHLAAIDTATARIPAQGQALAAASTPVVLTAAQITTLTPPAAITGFATETTLGSVKTAVELIDNAISGAGFNTTQFGGTNVSTGAGAGGAGIPRVTVSNDSSIILATGAATIGSLTANQSVNVAQIAGTPTVTGGVAGIQAVGGNVANAVAATANPVPVGGIFTTTPATLTTGQTATMQFTAAQNLKHDLTTIAGTAPTTVGKLDVKAADGDVFVRQTTAANLNATVAQLTLTKGTQGATGVTTQDLKDAGRVSIMITASVASTATAETLITLTRSIGLAATGTCSSCAITTGKTFRIQAISASARHSTGSASTNVTINLRAAVAGATTASSPLQVHTMVNVPVTLTNSVLFPVTLIPDGFEIASNGGTNTFGLTITHPQWVTGVTVVTFDLTLIGYEY